MIARLTALEAEPLERVIGRLIMREKYPEELARAVRVEFLRFVSLRFFTQEPVEPSPHVDDFWHAFILHTLDYARFCERHLGSFLHHEPRDHTGTPVQPLNLQATPRGRAKEFIAQLYPEHDEHIWTGSAICCTAHCDSVTCEH